MISKESEKKLLQILNPEKITYSSTAENFNGDFPSYSVKYIFQIKEEELNSFGKYLSEKGPKEDKLGIFLDRVVRASNAYLQFQDLIDLSSSDNDDISRMKEFVYNRGYFYYESLVYLRNAVVSILNANALSALALLRPFTELAIYFLYYKHYCKENGLQSLYDWINRDKNKNGFKNALQDIKKSQKKVCPSLCSLIDEKGSALQRYYDELCSYSHTPKIKESVGDSSGGFGPSHLRYIIYALDITEAVLNALFPLMIVAHPMLVFPVNENEKFGFNGPVGLFADQYNYEIIKNYMDIEIIKLLQENLKSNTDVISLLEYFESLKMMSEIDIRKSYYPETEDEIRAVKEETINALLARQKAKMRALGWFMNYIKFEEVR